MSKCANITRWGGGHSLKLNNSGSQRKSASLTPLFSFLSTLFAVCTNATTYTTYTPNKQNLVLNRCNLLSIKKLQITLHNNVVHLCSSTTYFTHLYSSTLNSISAYIAHSNSKISYFSASRAAQPQLDSPIHPSPPCKLLSSFSLFQMRNKSLQPKAGDACLD
jgi:hypothetical protein